MQKIMLTGLSFRLNIHELNHWVRSKLGSDCLQIVASRIARIDMCRALIFVCTLAIAKGYVTKCQQETAPLVMVGMLRLPLHWPTIVSKCNRNLDKKDRKLLRIIR
ncbi:Cytochrome P450 monooxygenase FUM15 [Fusarium oxysporum f. sp. albedinis]|nr:Cytochrome P450 monooxygenase FUM15 [Fusarium oxysporum f. sp. albedinis]